MDVIIVSQFRLNQGKIKTIKVVINNINSPKLNLKLYLGCINSFQSKRSLKLQYILFLIKMLPICYKKYLKSFDNLPVKTVEINDKNYLDKVDSIITNFGVGGLIYFKSNPSEIIKLTNRFQRITKIPLINSISY